MDHFWVKAYLAKPKNVRFVRICNRPFSAGRHRLFSNWLYKYTAAQTMLVCETLVNTFPSRLSSFSRSGFRFTPRGSLSRAEERGTLRIAEKWHWQQLATFGLSHFFKHWNKASCKLPALLSLLSRFFCILRVAGTAPTYLIHLTTFRPLRHQMQGSMY